MLQPPLRPLKCSFWRLADVKMQRESFSLPRKKVELPPPVLWTCSRSFNGPRISIIAARVNDSGGRKVQTQPETVIETANNVDSSSHDKNSEGCGGEWGRVGVTLCNLGVGSSLYCPASCEHMQKNQTSKSYI